MVQLEKMDLYQEKMQLRYHTPAEAEAIAKKTEIKTSEKRQSKIA